MGSIAYNFLADSFLLNPVLINNQYAKISDEEIRQELLKYRHFILENLPLLRTEINATSSNLKFFTGTTEPLQVLLKQTAFYLDQVVITDPLFPLTHEQGEIAETFTRFLGMNSDNSLNRRQISNAAKYLKDLSPMVAADYVKLIPTSLFSESPENIPIRYSVNGFSDVLPEELLGFYKNHAIVDKGKKIPGAILFDGSLDISRHIHIRFKDHQIEDAKGYILFEQIVNSVDKKKGIVDFTSYIPNDPPSTEEFNYWVSQSINQTAEHSYRRILFENKLANEFRASYLCTTPFTFNLLEQFFSPEIDIPTHSVNSVMQFILPFIENVDIKTLMKIRLEDGEAFENLRLEIDKRLKELRLIKDSEELKIKSENAFHDIFEVQVRQVNQKIKQIRRQIGVDLVLAAGGLLGAVQTGGWSLIALAAAMAKGYKSYDEYFSLKQQSPAFFLWKLQRNNI